MFWCYWLFILTRSRHFDFETPVKHTILWPTKNQMIGSFSVCDRFGLWPFRFVAVSVCGRSSLWPFWFVAFPVCGPFGLWPFRFVALTVCGHFDLWPLWSETLYGYIFCWHFKFSHIDRNECKFNHIIGKLIIYTNIHFDISDRGPFY